MEKNRISNERFEVSDTLLRLSEQTAYEDRPKSIPEIINFLVSRLHQNELCTRSLKVTDLSADYINGATDFGGAAPLVFVSEALKEAAISSIAEEIALRRQGLRVVLIAGPSSSGKTTFCKKLAYAIQQQGLHPESVSLDDYYGDSRQAPLGRDGRPDWESIYALNLPLLQSHIAQILQGDSVQLPTYDFAQGLSRPSGRTLTLAHGDILLLEGIHALNPELLSQANLPANRFFRIYISALTAYHSFDGGAVVPTTDNRLLRRMVRDFKFRNTTARQTIERWTSVREGEEKWIVPFQAQADVNFNSAYPYEYCLLREHALPLLEAVGPSDTAYSEAQRLIRLLHRYHKIPVRHLPPYSLLREFLGGSRYEY